MVDLVCWPTAVGTRLSQQSLTKFRRDRLTVFELQAAGRLAKILSAQVPVPHPLLDGSGEEIAHSLGDLIVAETLADHAFMISCRSWK